MNKENNPVTRTRFAPSPTGELHLGGARTALFNHLLAKRYHGQFILRVEDTDQERSKSEYINNQYDDLLWLGLKPDESPFIEGKHGPYQQTKRLSIYQKYSQELLAKQKVYYCFCSKEELAQEKEEFLAKNKRANYQYSRKCLQSSPAQIQNFLQSQRSYVLRLKVPQEKNYIFQDLVRGEIVFQGKDIEDFVIFRSNGFPLLNFAVVIDDYLMEVGHVLRGEEHLSNTAKQLVLYEAFGWTPPQFGHLSIILNKERKKLSKRDQETSEFQMIYQLKEKGYLPQAIVNYLLFLGWHPGEKTTREIFNLKEAIENFNLKGLHSRGAVFTLEKLNWYNNHYIQQLEEKKFAEYSWQFLGENYIGWLKSEKEKKEWVKKISLLFRSQLNYFQELTNLTSFFFQRPDIKNEIVWLEKLKKTKELLVNLEDWEEENIRQTLCDKKMFPLIRKKLTGQKSGPELPKIIYLLGKEEILKRLS